MAATVLHKRSATASASPSVSDISLGEIAVNTYDGKLFVKKSVSGTESIIEIGASGGAGGPIMQAAQTISADVTLQAGHNGLSLYSVAVDSGVTVSVPATSTWTVGKF
mgnify:FL=1|tara:strand:- start:30 stop:353 length:324 start_codon:yes stop_codon:yes gene_type:complete